MDMQGILGAITDEDLGGRSKMSEATGALPDLSMFGGALRAVSDAPAADGLSKLSASYDPKGLIPAPTARAGGGARGKYKHGTVVMGHVFGPADADSPDWCKSMGDMIPETDLKTTVIVQKTAQGARIRRDLMEGGKVPREEIEAAARIEAERRKAEADVDPGVKANLASLADLVGDDDDDDPDAELVPDQADLDALVETLPEGNPRLELKTKDEGTTGMRTKTTKDGTRVGFELAGYGIISSRVLDVRRVGQWVVLFRDPDEPGSFTPARDAEVWLSWTSAAGAEERFKATFRGLRFPDMSSGAEIMVMDIVVD